MEIGRNTRVGALRQSTAARNGPNGMDHDEKGKEECWPRDEEN
jgi:hypothetical protein